MTTEQKILTHLRGALEKHETLPFDQVRTVVLAAQEAAGKKKGSRRTDFRRLAPVMAACVALIAVLGTALHFLGPFQGADMAAPLEFETVTAETSSPLAENYTFGVDEITSDSGRNTAADNAAPTAPAESPDSAPGETDGSSLISRALLEQMAQHTDDPEYLYCVTVTPALGESAEEGGGQKEGSAPISPSDTGSVFLTAEEIYRLAGEGNMISLMEQ